jgi:ribosomal protein RSM22 (predicted rRNA methylase)
MSLLPGALRAALDNLAQGHGRTDLARRSRGITATYQARRNSSQALHSGADALAYALARMPATYAATTAALRQLQDTLPDCVPQTILDVGCGPGSASFAAAEIFTGLSQITLIDRNGPFLELAAKLAQTALTKVDIRFHHQDLSRAFTAEPADVVIAGYVLAELGTAVQATLITAMWQAALQALVLVEPGTPDGFARLKAARNSLIHAGAYIAAPCTHEAICPMAAPQWCRFLARVQRSRDHRILKGGEKSYEDEPYAYLVVSRLPPQARPSHRIVGRTVETKAAVRLPVCGPSGLSVAEAPHRSKKLFKDYQRLDWGDAVQIQNQPVPIPDEAGSTQDTDS